MSRFSKVHKQYFKAPSFYKAQLGFPTPLTHTWLPMTLSPLRDSHITKPSPYQILPHQFLSIPYIDNPSGSSPPNNENWTYFLEKALNPRKEDLSRYPLWISLSYLNWAYAYFGTSHSKND
jgi:hypothetical protein